VVNIRVVQKIKRPNGNPRAIACQNLRDVVK